MDLFEKVFEHLWQKQKKNKSQNDNILKVENVAKGLSALASSLLKNQLAENLEIVGSRDFVGLCDGNIYLPEKIDFFSQKNENRKIYLYLVLLICGSTLLKKQKNQFAKYSSPLSQRWLFLSQMFAVNNYLDQNFEGFRQFQLEVIQNIKSKFEGSEILPDQIFKTWIKYSLSREAFTVETADPFLKTKINKKIPNYLFFTVPCFEISTQKNQKKINEDHNLEDRNASIRTDLKKSYSSISQMVDLEKEPANPVTHSFEKLETADEYNGGRRFDSGDDQLEEHSAALDELNLSHMSTEGEAAQSMYQADSLVSVDFSNSELQPLSEQKYFLYPEWSVQKNKYLSNHCRIIENSLNLSDKENFDRENLSKKDFLRKEYRVQLQKWQKKIASLMSSPLWIKKLKEGDELDFDEYVRDYVLLKNSKDVEARWYIKKKPLIKDSAIIILFDQSWSSDSYIKNKRVLDIIIDSIGMAGLLFDEVIESVRVVGAYSSTRQNCNYQEYKKENESWDQFFSRTELIKAQGYTRLGPAIRHATKKLSELSNKKKLLLILTDGKPTDLDGYEGVHGVQDVKYACLEAENSGILPFALTVDESAKRHFPKMFKHYTLLEIPQKFSEEIFNILLQLIKTS